MRGDEKQQLSSFPYLQHGALALKGFRTGPPDLAILDIKMPRTDGIETFRLIRAKCDLPVIFLASKEEVLLIAQWWFANLFTKKRDTNFKD